MSKIGFIGLGNMGSPMSTNLIKAGHELKVFDLIPEHVETIAAVGGAAVPTAGEAARDVDYVITMLPAGRHVRDVYLSSGGVLESAPETAILIDCSTIDVATAREVADRCRQSGRRMLDAPVSGGVSGAEAASLTFMVGGSEVTFKEAYPILDAMGKNIIHAGGPGNGQAAKMCNNLILAISMIGTSEAFVLAEQLGLDHQKLFDISSTASGQSWALTSYCPVPGPVPGSPANRNYQAGFTAAMMLKDLKLAEEAVRAYQVSSPLGAEATSLYSAFVDQGHSEMDFSGIIKFIRGDLH